MTEFSKDSEVEITEEWLLYTIKPEERKEIMLQIKINNQPMQMDFDTGASVSIISAALYNNKFKQVITLTNPAVILKKLIQEK